MISQFGPPDRIKVSNSKGHDDWVNYLILGDRGYVSSAGLRWLDGDDYKFPFILLADPRFLMQLVESPSLDGQDEVSGRQAHRLVAKLDIDAYFRRLPARFQDPQFEREFRPRLEDANLRFWIDAQTYQVLQLELRGRPLPRLE